MQDSKRATTQKRKDERLAQNRSNTTAKRLMVLIVGVIHAVLLSNQLFQVPVALTGCTLAVRAGVKVKL